MKFESIDGKIFICNFMSFVGVLIQNNTIDRITSWIGFFTAVISFGMSVFLIILKAKKAVKEKNLDSFIESATEISEKLNEFRETLKGSDKNETNNMDKSGRLPDDCTTKISDSFGNGGKPESGSGTGNSDNPTESDNGTSGNRN